MKRILLLALSAFLMGILVFVLLVVWNGPLDDAREAPPLAPSRPASSDTSRPGVATVLEAPKDDESDSARENADPRVQEPGPTVERGSAVRVLALDKSRGTPVADALVRWIGSREYALALADPKQGAGIYPELVFQRNAKESHTDGEGLANLPIGGFEARVEVSARGLWGSTVVHLNPRQPVTIELVAERLVLLRVVDANGAAVPDVPLAIWAGHPPNSMIETWAGPSGPDGIARVRLARILQAQKARPTLFAGFDFPLPNLPSMSVDPDHLPAQPLQLVLPPCGSLDVLVRDARGRGVEHFVVDASLVALQKFVDGGVRFHPVRYEPGLAHFPFVGLNVGLRLRAQSDDGYRPVEIQASGPTRAGDTAVVELRFGESFPILTARLLAEDRSPLFEREVRVQLDLLRAGKGSLSMNRVLQSDGEGRVRVPVEIDLADGLRTRMLITVADPGSSTGAPGGVVSLDRSGGLQPGDNALGDLIVHPLALLASGRVVDVHGQPIEGARVSLVDRPGATRPDGRQPLPDLFARCDGEGRFEFRGELVPGPRSVNARATGFVDSALLDIELGMKEVNIVLRQAGEIVGRVAEAPGLDFSMFLIFARSSTQGERTDARSIKPALCAVESDGHFRIQGLAEGPYSVGACMRIDPLDPLCTLEGVRVPAGGKSTDARLDPLDLAPFVHTLAFEFVDESGAPITQGSLQQHIQNAVRPLRSWPIQNGRASLITHVLPIDLDVRAEGQRELCLRGLSTGGKFTLHGAIHVRVRAADSIHFPDAPLRLAVELRPAPGNAGDADAKPFPQAVESSLQQPIAQQKRDAASPLNDSRGLLLLKTGHVVELDQHHEGHAELELAGRWQVWWILGHTEGGKQSNLRSEAPTQEIDVLDIGGEQSFTLTISAEQYDALLQEAIFFGEGVPR